MKIKKDMIVKVVSGNFKGMTGKVLKVIPHSQRAIVEGVALTKRGVRPTQENPEGGFSDKEEKLIKSFSHVKSIKLFDRILRAETAAVLAISIINSYAE